LLEANEIANMLINRLLSMRIIASIKQIFSSYGIGFVMQDVYLMDYVWGWVCGGGECEQVCGIWRNPV